MWRAVYTALLNTLICNAELLIFFKYVQRKVSGSDRVFDFRVYLLSPVLDKICVRDVIK